MKKAIINSDRGLVMMETMFALPVYFIMLALLFWLGDMCMTRLALSNSERLRLWESGNWNNSGTTNIGNVFYFLVSGTTPDRMATSFSDFNSTFATVTTTGLGWGRIQSGRASVNTRASLWSWGISQVMMNSFPAGTGAPAANSAQPVRGRINNAGTPLDSAAMFRNTSNGGRGGRTSYSGSAKWNEIYLEKWGSVIVPPSAGSGAKALAPYTRNSYYVSWSR